MHAAELQIVIMSPEIIRMKEKKDTACGLVADAGALLRINGSREEQTSRLRIPSGHKNPTLAIVQWSILDQDESECSRVIRDGFIIIFNQERDVANVLLHKSGS